MHYYQGVTEPVEIRIYRGRPARAPFSKWLGALKDQRAVAIIQASLNRIRSGNFGDVRPVGDGVEERRIDFGPGERVYFGRYGQALVVLLCAGTKRTQDKDIETAIRLWRDCLGGTN